MSKDKRDIPQSNYNEIYLILKDLFISAFKWNGLPSEINPRFLEMTLFEHGNVAFFKDDVIGYLTLKTSSNGTIDVYGEPTKVYAFASNGYNKSLENHKDCVIIYNNFIRDTPQLRIMDYAKRIYNLERTIDINIHAQRTPVLLKTTKKLEFTVKNIYTQYDEYKPAIVVDNDFDTSNITAINTLAPFVADKIEIQKRRLWNEVLSFIGIENNFSEKNERLTENEVIVSNGLAISSRNSKLIARQTAVDEINRMFGLNVSVEPNMLSSFLEMAKEKEVNEIE